MGRAMEGGIDDVGLGVLFGLENYAYEFAGLLMHAEHLEAVHGVGPHTISVPRVKPAQGVDPVSFEGGVSDELFQKIAACIRVAVPYTGMIISTRESQKVREKMLRAGVSQISGASRTSVGGYAEGGEVNSVVPDEDTRQFEVSDTRTLDEVLHWLIDSGYIPSFCTACYRNGRTGDRFMSLAKSGQIKNVCLPNALMTLCEYAMDYGGTAFREKAAALVRREISGIANETIRRKTAENVEKIMTSGGRDFFV
jgi:2-iminoacetate synthase